jgi:hypothetical protein
MTSRIESTPIPGSPHPLIFDSESHQYSVNGRRVRGPSSIIEHFCRPFDSNYWSYHIAKKKGVTQAEILARWDAKRDASCDLGHLVHDFADSLASGTATPPPGEAAKHCIGIINAYRDLRITPIKAEKKICDPPFGVMGIVDLVCKIDPVNEKGLPHDCILDWKTNAKIDMANKYGDTMLSPLSHLDDCNFNHYSLQLNLYRFMLARRYDFHAKRMAIVWLPGNSTYQLIKVPRMDAEVALILSAWQRKVA